MMNKIGKVQMEMKMPFMKLNLKILLQFKKYHYNGVIYLLNFLKYKF
jgi:hypothetical protein